MSKGKNRKRKGKSNTEVLTSVLSSDYVSQYNSEVTSKKNQKQKRARDVQSPSTKMSNEEIIGSIIGEKCIKDDEPILVEDYIENPTPEEKKISNTYVSSLSREKVSCRPLIKAIREFNSSCQKLSIDFDKERISFKGTDDSIYHVIDFEGNELISYTFDRKNIIDIGIKT